MKYPIVLALLAAAGVCAQTSGCADQTKVARCLEAAAKPAGCEDNERCLCGVYKEISACYIPCPSGDHAVDAEKQVDAYCEVKRKRSFKEWLSRE
ncbi:hypothetical protein MRS44_015561 [Fusarium solani]|uniref:Extracellular membrane protein CFEM domain-containing protein n=1 Tax=Fusarium solani TaxID=169388 RepID=A0A9P9HAT8_FUSSL|nr:uncharacterized protein B0J15DRAFT_550006 [Fusarium solani]KAH7253282.1 hypothetical protein B0J15DRAFT_550006 [Fusarium solani]KAJ3459488.1 hypothetical protein MRS44_015561 [Fusarium solani]